MSFDSSTVTLGDTIGCIVGNMLSSLIGTNDLINVSRMRKLEITSQKVLSAAFSGFLVKCVRISPPAAIYEQKTSYGGCFNILEMKGSFLPGFDRYKQSL